MAGVGAGEQQSGLHSRETLLRAEGEQTEGDGPGVEAGGWRLVVAEHGLTEGQEKRQC